MTSHATAVQTQFKLLEGLLDERLRRCVAAAEAKALGRGGVSAVSRATGVSRRAIRVGLRELAEASGPGPGRVRKSGAGRKRTVDTDPTLLQDLILLVEPTARGDPESPLRWTCKSVRHLAKELTDLGHRTSHRMVAALLRSLDYSLQANRKTREGTSHPDRNAQFEYIDRRAAAYLRSKDPVVSVDTKKKELVGDFKNGGREWEPRGGPVPVAVHDFVRPDLGRAIPYGVYDVGQNVGWVSVGIDHDTAAFAVESLRRWWYAMGQARYPEATRLLVTADAGGSNSPRVHLWKVELQKLADEIGRPIAVCHFPPGTSNWNKIEHRLFSFITMNWRGKPLITHEVIVSLIAATTTTAGLRVRAQLDTNAYPKGVKVSQQDLGTLNLRPARFHGDWNYVIAPRRQ